MRFSLIMIMIFSWSVSFAQEKLLKRETIEILDSVLFIKEVSPIEKDESDAVNELLNKAMELYFNSNEQDSLLIKYAFAKLYGNSRSYYDDAPDERRLKSRRALCFVAIALLCEPESRLTFIEYSKFSIIGGIKCFENEFFVQKCLGIALLELLFKHEGQQLIRQDVEKIQDFVNLQSDNLPSHIQEKTFDLLNIYFTKVE